jgi:hypothetical protein
MEKVEDKSHPNVMILFANLGALGVVEKNNTSLGTVRWKQNDTTLLE